MTIRTLLYAGPFALSVMLAGSASLSFRADTAVARSTFSTMPPEPWAPADPADSLYRAGREAINKAEYRRAASIFAEIVAKYPRSEYAADAYYYRAFALYRSGREDDLREALKSLDAQKKRFPKAKMSRDADDLDIRIRGVLAQRGDAESAAKVSERASQTTTQCNRDDDENDIRTAALNALQQMDSQNALPIIKQVLQKRDACSVSMRKKAVFLLSQHQTSQTESLMLDVIRNDPAGEVREQAVFWLGQVQSDGAAAALEDLALNSSDIRLREKAVFALTQQNRSRGAAFLRRLANASETPRSVREQAIFQLGQQGSAENAEFLRGLFSRLGSNEGLQKNVLFSLSQMGRQGNDRWLLGVALDKANSDDVRKHALWTAGQAGIPSSELISLYDRLTDAPLKEQLIWVLSDSRGSGATDKLVEIAQKDPDREMRKKAIFWLGQKNDPRILKLLTDIITKP